MKEKIIEELIAEISETPIEELRKLKKMSPVWYKHLYQKTEETMDKTIQKTIERVFGFDEDWNNNDTYKKVLEHRGNCPKWGKEFCLDCFGGGLTKFTENLRQELKQKCENPNVEKHKPLQ